MAHSPKAGTGVRSLLTKALHSLARAAAPLLPPVQSPKAPIYTDVLPPFGTNPPTGPVVTAPSDYGDRLLPNDPRELWYLALPPKLTPRQVAMILRSALGGDLWQQWQLAALMTDTWPMLRKCAHELRSAAARTKFTAAPYCEPGQPPTDRAKEKADLVQRAIAGMKPEPGTDENGWFGTVYDAGDAMLSGLTLLEVLWAEKRGELLPRCTAWVHPRHFTYTNDGRISVFDQYYQRLMWQAGKGTLDSNKFFPLQFKSKSGSSLGAGLVRTVAWHWSSLVHCREWTLCTAQRHGSPFLDIAFEPGMSDLEIAKLKSFAAQAMNDGFIVHPSNATVNLVAPPAQGSDNPQQNVKREAEEAVQILFLGQTATTSPTPGKLGNDDQHGKVKQENVDSLVAWIAEDLGSQLARAVVRLNYGDEDEVPTVGVDRTGEEDPADLANRDQVFLNSGVPMVAEDFYKRHKLKMPADGDKVVVGGKLGILSGSEEDIDVTPGSGNAGLPGSPPGEQQSRQPGQPGQPAAPGQEENEVEAEDLDEALAEATDAELSTLKELALKARSGSNGESAEVAAMVSALSQRRRSRL